MARSLWPVACGERPGLPRSAVMSEAASPGRTALMELFEFVVRKHRLRRGEHS